MMRFVVLGEDPSRDAAGPAGESHGAVQEGDGIQGR